MAEIVGISRTAVYSCLIDKDGYFYGPPCLLSQHTRCGNSEPGVLAQKTVIDRANATEAGSVARIESVVEDFLTDKGKGQRGESGNYRQDASRELDRFIDFSPIMKML